MYAPNVNLVAPFTGTTKNNLLADEGFELTDGS